MEQWLDIFIWFRQCRSGYRLITFLKIAFVGWLCLLTDLPLAIAQVDSAVSKQVLPDVVIEEYGTAENPFLAETLLIDSLQRSGSTGASLAELMALSGLATTKSYGVNGVSTLSLRGSSASQTAILWNGINLNNPQLGQADISLLPADIFESIEIQPNTSLNSLNAIGGSIQLGSDENIDSIPAVRLKAKIGSFQDFRGIVVGQQGIRNLRLKIAGYGQAQQNNIRYKNPYHGNRIERLEHANNQQIGLNFVSMYKFRYGNIRAVCWGQNTLRQIPPTLSQAYSEATQHDFFARNLITVSFSDFWVKKIDLARLDDQIRFEDSPANIHSFGRSTRYVGSVCTKYLKISKIENLIQLQGEWATASILEYQTPKEQAQITVKGSSTYAGSWFGTQIGIAYQAVSKINVPLTGAALFYVYPLDRYSKVSRLLKLSANIAHEVRIPTLNDRYWKPGGNLDLLPEESWRKELIISIQRTHLKLQLTGFRRDVLNWIQWLPTGGFFSAENIPLVVAQGVEAAWSFKIPLKKGSLKHSCVATFNRVQKEKSQQPLDESLYKQLIFIPIYNCSIQMDYAQKRWFCQLNGTLKGYRFTLADNSEYLPGYMLIGLSGGRNFQVRKNNWFLTTGIDNLLNQSYQIIPGRPMQGISIWSSIQYKFN